MTEPADQAAALVEVKSWLGEDAHASEELVNVACAYLEVVAELQATRERISDLEIERDGAIVDLANGLCCELNRAKISAAETLERCGCGLRPRASTDVNAVLCDCGMYSTGDTHEEAVTTWNRAMHRPAPPRAEEKA